MATGIKVRNVLKSPSSASITLELPSNANYASIPFTILSIVTDLEDEDAGCYSREYTYNDSVTIPLEPVACSPEASNVIEVVTGQVETGYFTDETRTTPIQITYTVNRLKPVCECVDDGQVPLTGDYDLISSTVSPYRVDSTAVTSTVNYSYVHIWENACGEQRSEIVYSSTTINFGPKPQDKKCEYDYPSGVTHIQIGDSGFDVEWSLQRSPSPDCNTCTPSTSNEVINISYSTNSVPYSGGDVSIFYTLKTVTIDDKCNKKTSYSGLTKNWHIDARTDDGQPTMCSSSAITSGITLEPIAEPFTLTVTQLGNINDPRCNKTCEAKTTYDTANHPYMVEYWSNVIDYSDEAHTIPIGSHYEWVEFDSGTTADPCAGVKATWNEGGYVPYDGGRIRITFEATGTTVYEDCSTSVIEYKDRRVFDEHGNYVSGLSQGIQVELSIGQIDCSEVSGTTERVCTRTVEGVTEEMRLVYTNAQQRQQTYKIQYKDATTQESDPVHGDGSNVVTYDFIQEYKCDCPYSDIYISTGSNIACSGGTVQISLRP